MRWNPIRELLAAGAAALLLPLLGAPAGAATLSFSGSVNDVSVFQSYDSDDPPSTGFTFTSQVVTGLPKFDPSLGTLTAVKVTSSFNAALRLGVTANMPQGNHFVAMNLPFAQSFIGYRPAGVAAVAVLADVQFSNGVFCSGGNFPCAQVNDVGGAANTTTDVTTFTIFQQSDFQGAGNVTALNAIIALPDTVNFVLLNVNRAFGNLAANLTVHSIGIEYVFDPIPEPSTAMLMGAGLVGLLGVLRRVR